MSAARTNAIAVPDGLTDEELDARLTELALAANRDDGAALELHALCTAYPAVWARFGSLEHDAIDGWVHLLAPDAAHQPHAVRWKRDQIADQVQRRRKKLLADGHSPLEVLLANRILSAWLMVMEADSAYARWLHKGGAFREGEYHQKRLDRAQRQLLRAVQALATVRRLLRPTQVNIAQNQVNVVG